MAEDWRALRSSSFLSDLNKTQYLNSRHSPMNSQNTGVKQIRRCVLWYIYFTLCCVPSSERGNRGEWGLKVGYTCDSTGVTASMGGGIHLPTIRLSDCSSTNYHINKNTRLDLVFLKSLMFFHYADRRMFTYLYEELPNPKKSRKLTGETNCCLQYRKGSSWLMVCLFWQRPCPPLPRKHTFIHVPAHHTSSIVHDCTANRSEEGGREKRERSLFGTSCHSLECLGATRHKKLVPEFQDCVAGYCAISIFFCTV